MKYYNVALYKSVAPHLTYCYDGLLEPGTMVTVPLKGTTKEAVVISETAKPDFACETIVSVLDRYYTQEQMALAKFIADYYFSSFSEAISLFIPHKQHDKNRIYPLPTTRYPLDPPALTPTQQHAYEQLLHKDRAVLFGVTGSGKTEVFIARMVDTLKQGKNAVLLMPEIALTPQMETRLRRYFGDAVAIWHSKITKKKKEAILEGIRSGAIRIVAGARSALFVPMPHLGLIVVDEEHDDSYKSQTRPRYHARDVALLMGKTYGAQVILASATPSVSSMHKYDVVKLDKPYVQTQKRYRFIPGDGITAPVIYALREHVEAGGQSLVFLPTRGNFKYLYCPSCGKTHTCPYCSVGMALHRKRRYLKCHYCHYTEVIRESCAYCSHTPLLSERIGTQEAIAIITEAIEGITIEQFDSDAITTPGKLKKALKRFASKQSRVLLGTQMLAKGHDYADITLSVILGLDHTLGLADYRAKERAIALMIQIAGRCGRAKAAEVLIQTADPGFFEPYIDNYEGFVQEELIFRELALYPPFGSFARIVITNKNDAKAAKICEITVRKLRGFDAVTIVGHGKAPIERIAGKYRYHIVLKSKRRTALLKALHAVKSRDIEIDMDPVEFS